MFGFETFSPDNLAYYVYLATVMQYLNKDY